MESLKNVVDAVMKLPPSSASSGAESVHGLGIGRYVEGTLCFSEAEAGKLHEQFKVLYLNKISSKRPRGIGEMHSHQPTLSKGTRKLAQKSRRHNLYMEKTNYEVSLLNEIARTNAEREKECTFKPKLTEYHTINRKTSLSEQQ